MVSTWHVFSGIFHACCFITTSGLISFWIYKFSMNEDLSTVEYKEYNNDGIGTSYMSSTICFKNPFVSSNKAHLNQSQKNEYLRYFMGDETSKEPDFSYEKVALNLTDFVQQYYLRLRNGTKGYYKPFEFKFDVIQESFNGFWLGYFYRCFELVAPHSDVEFMGILVDNMVHDQGIREISYSFLIFFHYPHQILRPSLFYQHTWPKRRTLNGSRYQMLFTVENVEIYKRRKSCKPNVDSYDELIMKNFMKKIGCSPSYLKENFNFTTCNTSKQLKLMAESINLNNKHGVDPPCTSLEFMTFKYDEIELENLEDGEEDGRNFWISLVVPNKSFKEFTQTKAIDLQALIGNVGGYIGLVFGTSIISILPYIKKVFISSNEK